MIGPGAFHLTRDQRAAYGAQCAEALRAAIPAKQPEQRKKAIWQPPEFIDIDRLAVNPYPASKSRFN